MMNHFSSLVGFLDVVPGVYLDYHVLYLCPNIVKKSMT